MKWKSHRIIMLTGLLIFFSIIAVATNINIKGERLNSSKSYNLEPVKEFDWYFEDVLNPFTTPNISIDLPSDGLIQHSNTLVDVDVQCAGLDTVYYNWDAIPNQTWLSPYITFTPIGDGVHYLMVFANDTLGSNITTSFRFIIDDNGPVIEYGIDTVSSNRSGTLVHISIDEVNNNKTVLYGWDSPATNNWTFPYHTYRPSGNGWHTLHVYAEDIIGHTDTAEFQFYIYDPGPEPSNYWVYFLIGSLALLGIGAISAVVIIKNRNERSSQSDTKERKMELITCPACGNKNLAYGGYCIYCGKLFEGYEGIEIPEDFDYMEGINIKFCPSCGSTVKDFVCTKCGKNFNKS